MASAISTIATRRRFLQAQFDVSGRFAELEESCVPSYCHRNGLAAGVAWWRLVTAARLWRRHAGSGPVLDFGSSCGELAHFLDAPAYHYVEEDETLAEAAASFVTGSQRRTLETLEAGHYGAVFALDSLEHNEDFEGLIQRLIPALADGGVFVLSGPTENLLYRMGRRIAGFRGHGHVTTIADIEAAAGRHLTRVGRVRVPVGVPLFSISVWRRPDA